MWVEAELGDGLCHACCQEVLLPILQESRQIWSGAYGENLPKVWLWEEIKNLKYSWTVLFVKNRNSRNKKHKNVMIELVPVSPQILSWIWSWLLDHFEPLHSSWTKAIRMRFWDVLEWLLMRDLWMELRVNFDLAHGFSNDYWFWAIFYFWT